MQRIPWGFRLGPFAVPIPSLDPDSRALACWSPPGVAAHCCGPCPQVLCARRSPRRWGQQHGHASFERACRAPPDDCCPIATFRAFGPAPPPASAWFAPVSLGLGGLCFDGFIISAALSICQLRCAKYFRYTPIHAHFLVASKARRFRVRKKRSPAQWRGEWVRWWPPAVAAGSAQGLSTALR